MFKVPAAGFGPVGKCIYCAAEAPTPLQREHVVPRALDGGIILHLASCDSCACITKKIEEHVCGGVLGEVRGAAKLRRSRGKKRRKDEPMPLTFQAEDGTARTIDVPPEKHPGIGLMFRFDRPGLFDAIEREKIQAVPAFVQHRKTDPSLGLGDAPIIGQFNVDFWIYMRFVAKMAHGLAVFELGLDGFEPSLVPIIRNECTSFDIYQHVGGSLQPSPPMPGTHHVFGIEILDLPSGQYVVLDLRLFASAAFESPLYRVIVGRPNAMTQARLQQGPFYQTVTQRRSGRNHGRTG